MNGDGLDDVLVGAIDGGANGEIYVVFGKASTTAVEASDIKAGNGGFSFGATGTHNVFSDIGSALAGNLDINGDGSIDFIGGAPFAPVTLFQDQGRAWAIFNPIQITGSSTYTGRTRVGDGPGGAGVPPATYRSAGVTLKFSDGDFADNGAGGASTEQVTVIRSNASIENLPQTPANVLWEITTDRVGFSQAGVTFRYTDEQIEMLDESTLTLYKADSPLGPWTALPTNLKAKRNEISAPLTSFSYFAIGGEAVVLSLNLNGRLMALVAGVAIVVLMSIRTSRRSS